MRQQWVHLAASAAAFAGLVHRAAGATIPEFTEEEYTPEEYEPSGLVEQLHSFYHAGDEDFDANEQEYYKSVGVSSASLISLLSLEHLPH